MNALFKHVAALLPGEYFQGHYSWENAVRLTGARLICQAPAAGSVRIGLEVNGAPTSNIFEVTPLTPCVSLPLAVEVPAGQRIRFQVLSFDGLPEDAADEASIVVSIGGEYAIEPVGIYAVWWVDGLSRLPLYSYDPQTAAFTALAATAGRGTIALDTETTITVAGDSVQFAGDGLHCAEVHEQGVMTSPRLEFRFGDVLWGAVEAGGRVYAARFREVSPIVEGELGYRFFAGATCVGQMLPAEWQVTGLIGEG